MKLVNDNVALYRCIIKLETNKFYLVKNFSGKWFILKKNEFIKNLIVKNDYHFFAERKRGYLLDILIPVDKDLCLNNCG